MLKFKMILLLLLLPLLCNADEKVLIARFPADNPEYNVYQIVSGQKKALTTNWALVIDGSNSTSRIMKKLIASFHTVVSFPEDDLKFCTILFNDRGHPKFRNWHDASTAEFNRTARWIKRNVGVNSYGKEAIRKALLQPRKHLTVIVISDGGFSENFSEILKTVKETQQWRIREGYGLATIVSLGVENHLSRLSIPPYPKDTDEVCQDRMKQLGIEGFGGYYYVVSEK